MIIPNSFQTPNLYIDRLMPLLTDPEFRVLIYATRRIFGFNKRQDQIALSQFVNGLTTKQGTVLDYGAGLSKGAAVKAIAALVEYDILLKLSENIKNEGAEYALQTDENLINWDGLAQRAGEKEAANQRRTARAREKKGQSIPQTAVYPTDRERSIPQTASGLSDRHTKDSRNTVETQRGKTPTPKDPRKDHPAILLIRAVVKTYPPKEVWDIVIEKIGETPDRKRFEEVYKTWRLRGYSPKNLEGLLDWYVKGIPTNGHKPQAQPVTQEYRYADGTQFEVT